MARRRRQPRSRRRRRQFFTNRKVARSGFCDGFFHHIGPMLTEVRYQGRLGSCTAHAVCAAVSWYLCKLYKLAVAPKLAVQFIVDWAMYWSSEDGLSFEEVFEVFMTKGVPLEDSYPYVGMKRTITDRWDPQGLRVKIGGFKRLEDMSFEAVCKHLRENGPVLAQVNVSYALSTFCDSQDIFDHPSNNDVDYRGKFENNVFKRLRHSVLVMGFGPDSYLFQNSWGRRRGFHGFVKIMEHRLYNFHTVIKPRFVR